MSGKLRLLFAACVLACGFAAVQAQNLLLDNPNHKKSIELKRLAEKAFSDGDFEKSTEYAREAERLSLAARSEAETERMRFLSYNRLRLADRRIAFCEKQDAKVRYPEVWPEALEARKAAGERFDAKEYAASIEASDRVISLLSVVMPKEASRPAAAAAELPAFYVVRLIPERRDCFWRIAGYPFVYGDPLKWTVLYEANKAKLVDPENPDLIHPGLELSIPSLAGEKRAGVWKE